MRSPRIISLLLIVGLAALAMPNAAASSCTSGNFNEVQQCPGELSGSAVDAAEMGVEIATNTAEGAIATGVGVVETAVPTALGIADQAGDTAQEVAHDVVVFAGTLDELVLGTVQFVLDTAESVRQFVEDFLEP